MNTFFINSQQQQQYKRFECTQNCNLKQPWIQCLCDKLFYEELQEVKKEIALIRNIILRKTIDAQL